MILIISEAADKTTNEVIIWLHNLGLNPIRLNSEDNILINKLDISNNQIEIKLRDITIDLSKVEIFWFRKGTINFCGIEDIDYVDQQIDFNREDIYKFLKFELNVIRNYIFSKLEQTNIVLGSYFKWFCCKIM